MYLSPFLNALKALSTRDSSGLDNPYSRPCRYRCVIPKPPGPLHTLARPVTSSKSSLTRHRRSVDGDVGRRLLVKSKPGGRVYAITELMDNAVLRVITVVDLNRVVAAGSVVL